MRRAEARHHEQQLHREDATNDAAQIARVARDDWPGDDLVRPDFIEPQKDERSGCEHDGHDHPPTADAARGANDKRGCAEDGGTGGRQPPGPRQVLARLSRSQTGLALGGAHPTRAGRVRSSISPSTLRATSAAPPNARPTMSSPTAMARGAPSQSRRQSPRRPWSRAAASSNERGAPAHQRVLRCHAECDRGHDPRRTGREQRGRELSDVETSHQRFRSPKLASASLNASAMSLCDSPPRTPAATVSQNRSRRAARPIRACVRG